MEDPKRLRELARWYREFAEKTGNPVIWDCRLQTADDLDAEAERIKSTQVAHHPVNRVKIARTSVPVGDS